MTASSCSMVTKVLPFLLGITFCWILRGYKRVKKNDSESRKQNNDSSNATASQETNNYSNPNQLERYAYHKSTCNSRVLNIDQYYQPKLLQNRKVLITGANRGLGLALAKEAHQAGAVVYATCRRSLQDCPELVNLNLEAVISNVDVTNDKDMEILLQSLQNVSTIDIVIHNAGYFMTERESMLQNTMNYPEELQMINICAVSTLRVTQVLYNSNKLQSGSKIVMITSQGGSISWRKVQCPNGGDYGHHMSKAAANMAGTLLANEFQSKGIIVPILHPGFVRTDMTRKYSSIWDAEGAVDSNIGAKRVLHEISQASIGTSGVFVNCEDGLEIPW